MKITAAASSMLLLLAVARVSAGDEVELETGGRVVGQIGADAARSELRVELPGDGHVVLDRSRLARVRELSPAESEYRRRAATVPDTAEAQFKLALWCREHKMGDALDAHLRRVVELDANHEEARALLGYQRHDGEWLTRDQLMASRGLLRHEGGFRTRQEIELMARAERNEQTAADWRQRLGRWRRWLVDGDPQRTAEAVEAFRTLKDPAAADALAGLLADETNPEVQIMLINAAAQIEHPATVRALAELSLNDERHEVRQQCLEHLIKAQRPGLAAIYVQSLKSRDNDIVNRAAEALGALGAAEAVGPLIEALVTRHEVQVGPASGNHTYTMSGSGTFSFGGGGPKKKRVNAPNPQVRSALVKLTERDFGFDVESWRRWLAANAFKEHVDLRRDP